MLDFNRTPPSFFPRSRATDSTSLSGALFHHASAVESCLAEAGQRPGIAYSALDVLRIAACLMAAPLDMHGCPRWTEPDPRDETDERPSEPNPDGDDLPF